MEYQAASVMTSKLISISENQEIEMAENLMKVNKIRHLPVTNSENQLVGVVSVKDTARVADKKSKVRRFMSRSVRFVKKTDGLRSVIEMMLRYKICSVLVTNDNDIVGIVTTEDLLRLLSKKIDQMEKSETLSESMSFLDESWMSLK